MISVLYVDDEHSLLDICKIFLERNGEFSVTTESSPVRALAILKTRTFDAVVSDYQMPDMDGIEFLRLLRKDHPLLPFIILTGRGREEIAIAAFENGADFYLQKGGDPVSQFAELSHKIRRSVEQRNAEQTLVESETRLRALMLNTNEIIRILDKDGTIIFDSPAAARLLGFPEGSFLGKKPTDFIHPDDIQTVTEALAEVRDRRNPGTPTEFRIRTGNGDYVDAESTAMNLIGVKGVDGIVVTTRLIAERKRTERMLRESGENYRDLYDNAPYAYYTIDRDGRITRCNNQAARLLRTTPGDLIGRKISGYYADTDAGKKKAGELFAGFRNGKEISNEELQMERADGTLIWISLTVNAMRDRAGTITGSRTIVTDITQHRLLEENYRKKNETLSENRRVLDTLIHNLPGMVYRCRNDPDWTMEFVSDGCESLTGYTAAELIENRVVSYGSLIPAEERQHVRDEVQRGISGKEPFRMIYRIRDRPGAIRWVWEQGRGVFGENGELRAIEGYITDITGKKQTEDAIRIANRKLQLLSGITRHDIKNQTVILRAALNLFETGRLNPKEKKLIEMARKSAETIEGQIEFTREYENFGNQEPRWQDISTIIRKAAQQFLPGNLQIEMPGEEYEIFADPLIGKVFFNLMDNTLRHGGMACRFGISCRKDDEGLRIIIEDNGSGIPADDKERIFEKNFGRNTGLGLFLAREIVAVTGISITETGEWGRGARFEIAVPNGAYRDTRPADDGTTEE